jgi:hypothetical protein
MAKVTFTLKNLIMNNLENKYSLEFAQIRNIVGNNLELSMFILRECAD